MDNSKTWEAPVVIEVSKLPEAMGDCTIGSAPGGTGNCINGTIANDPFEICDTGGLPDLGCVGGPTY